MALFGRKKDTEKTKSPASKAEAVPPDITGSSTLRSLGGAGDLSHVLRSPRITEKASEHMGIGVYAFDVAKRATKRSIQEAVFALYNVRPRAIRIVNIPQKVKRSMRTGKRGVVRGGKKAYVYLKKGETITIA